MAAARITMSWSGGLRFSGGASDATRITVDGDGVAGPSPVQTLLLALGGCMAADIVEIGGKMRVPLDSLQVELEGERAAEPPRRFTRIVLRCRAGSSTENTDKLRRALDLSLAKYCSVLHTLRPDLEFVTELETV